MEYFHRGSSPAVPNRFSPFSHKGTRISPAPEALSLLRKQRFHSGRPASSLDRAGHQYNVIAKSYFMKSTKLGSKRSKPLQNLLVIDVETVAGIRKSTEGGERIHTPVLIGLYDGEAYKAFSCRYPRTGTRGIAYRAVKHLADKYRGYTVFGHNWSGFDMNFMLPALTLYMLERRKLGEEVDVKTVISGDRRVISTRLEWYSLLDSGQKVASFIEFRDSLNYFPGMSLDRVSRALLQEGKSELPFD